MIGSNAVQAGNGVGLFLLGSAILGVVEKMPENAIQDFGATGDGPVAPHEVIKSPSKVQKLPKAQGSALSYPC